MRALVGAAYGVAAAARERLYRRGWLRTRSLPRPTISVGALAVGGTGKTPATVALCELLRDRGLRPAILSRGYRRRSRGPLLVSTGDDGRPMPSFAEAGDEPAMMARILAGVPVAVAARRERAARRVLEATDVDAFLLDDGFQHLRVARDADLLAVDPADPFWEDRPLPAGRLRERPEAAGRADAFLVVGDPEAAALVADRFPGHPTFSLIPEPPRYRTLTEFLDGEADPGAEGDIATGTPARPPEELTERVLGFAGIARPRRFWEGLEAAGIALVGRRSFPDHHPFDADDLRRLRRAARQADATALITTEKDAVRLPADAGTELPVYVWRHRLGPVDAEALWSWLRPRLGHGEPSPERSDRDRTMAATDV